MVVGNTLIKKRSPLVIYEIDPSKNLADNCLERKYSRVIFSSYQFYVFFIWVPKSKVYYHQCITIYKFFVNYDEWLQQSRNIHFQTFKTLKLLWFLRLWQWNPPDLLCTWTFPGGSQLLLYPSSIGNLLSGDWD